MGIGYDLFYNDFIENSICHKNNVQKVYCSNIIRLIPKVDYLFEENQLRRANTKWTKLRYISLKIKF